MEGLLSRGTYNQNRKNASKQAIAALVKKRYGFTGFLISSKIPRIIMIINQINSFGGWLIPVGLIFLVCNHVTRQPCWGIYMKIEFSSQRR